MQQCIETLKGYYECVRKDYLNKLVSHGIDIQDKSISLVSPWMCICLILVLPKPRGSTITLLEAYETCVKFTILYIHIDRYLDSTNITPQDKKEFIKWMSNPSDSTCTIRSKLWNIKKELELRYDDASTWLDELTAITTTSAIAQYSTDSTSTDLKKVCFEKGAITLLTVYRLIYGSNILEEHAIRNLGECIQLLDDIVDCSKDIKDSINTYCTITVLKYANMDRCARLLINKLTSACATVCIDNKYQIVLMGIQLSLRYTILRSNYFSLKLRTKIGLVPYCVKTKSFLKIVDKRLRDM